MQHKLQAHALARLERPNLIRPNACSLYWNKDLSRTDKNDSAICGRHCKSHIWEESFRDDSGLDVEVRSRVVRPLITRAVYRQGLMTEIHGRCPRLSKEGEAMISVVPVDQDLSSGTHLLCCEEVRNRDHQMPFYRAT